MMSPLEWNLKGLGNMKKQVDFTRMLRDKKIEIFGIIETKLQKEK